MAQNNLVGGCAYLCQVAQLKARWAIYRYCLLVSCRTSFRLIIIRQAAWYCLKINTFNSQDLVNIITEQVSNEKNFQNFYAQNM